MPDWGAMFGLDINGLELVLRMSIVYVALLTALRVMIRREIGALGAAELLVLLLVAGGVQNATVGESSSITGGAIVAVTLIAWNYLLDYLAFHLRPVERWLRPPPVTLVRDGRMLRRNMRRELITEDELRTHLRLQGIDDISEVKTVLMEPDGDLSVISHNGSNGGGRNEQRKHNAL